jgi:aspartate-semialdehyde dehydrogenase
MIESIYLDGRSVLTGGTNAVSSMAPAYRYSIASSGGYGASVFIEMTPGVGETEVRRALQGGVLQMVGDGDAVPSNESVVGESEMKLRLEAAGGSGFWLWMAGDNLRLAANNAVRCALELASLRPAGGVN